MVSKITEIVPNAIVHQVQITSEDDFDDEFFSWISEAYEVGQQKHLDARTLKRYIDKS